MRLSIEVKEWYNLGNNEVAYIGTMGELLWCRELPGWYERMAEMKDNIKESKVEKELKKLIEKKKQNK